ncbi:MAG: cyclic nucleotide-binding domain-containing protein [Acidimicrobiales bacterium]|jgi:CRP-like cAMP-binding protein|nr:cyclic nucleotide-binding domain-containing protein [Acidimicrobiales bacterium]
MDEQAILELLATEVFFAGVTRDDLARVASCGTQVHLPAGTVIFREGASADACWLVLEGRVSLETHAPGHPSLRLSTIGRDQILGWSWLFEPYRWHFDARALDEVAAVAFDGPALRRLFETEPRLGYEMLRRFTQLAIDRLQATRLQLLDLYGPRVGPGPVAVFDDDAR